MAGSPFAITTAIAQGVVSSPTNDSEKYTMSNDISHNINSSNRNQVRLKVCTNENEHNPWKSMDSTMDQVGLLFIYVHQPKTSLNIDILLE